jgi:hypothetical protein
MAFDELAQSKARKLRRCRIFADECDLAATNAGADRCTVCLHGSHRLKIRLPRAPLHAGLFFESRSQESALQTMPETHAENMELVRKLVAAEFQRRRPDMAQGNLWGLSQDDRAPERSWASTRSSLDGGGDDAVLPVAASTSIK